jgi:TRAP-type C4-dicarboxylate transport system substrate-binding protein
VNEPKRTASGGIDLTGMKLRSSPAYRDFIKALGGTAVVMAGGEVYTALERGTINGMGIGLTEVLDWKLDKFVKYRIEPAMTYTGLFMIMNQKVYDGLPQQTRELLDKLSVDWENESREYWKVAQDQQKAKLEAAGIKTVTLPDAASAQFVRTFRKDPMARMEKNPKIKIDLKKLRKLVNFD